jgi:hypothetical protein
MDAVAGTTHSQADWYESSRADKLSIKKGGIYDSENK